MKKFNLLFVSFFIFTGYAHAGQQVGNGGAAVVGDCYGDNNGITEPLDLFEAKTMRGLSVDLDVSRELPIDDQMFLAIEIMLKRLERVDVLRANIYRDFVKNFLKEAVFLNNGAKLNIIDDVGNIRQFIPAGCSIVQAAMQRTPLNPPLDKRYVLDGKIWKNMDASSRAALVMHEIIYRDAIARGHTESISTRFIVGYLASSSFENLSQDDYDSMMTDNYMSSYNFFQVDPFAGTHVLSYFETRQDTHSEAVKFCASLSSSSNIVSGNYFGYFKRLGLSNFWQFILSEAGDGSKYFWRWGVSSAETPNVYFVSKVSSGDAIESDAPANTKIGTMCYRLL